jgi:Family of unknown function (DUF6459)
MRMYTATEERHDPPPAIRLRPVPRCDPPFDDELPSDAWVSADQLPFPWTRASDRAPAGAFSSGARVGAATTPDAPGIARASGAATAGGAGTQSGVATPGGGAAYSGPDGGAGAAGSATRPGCAFGTGTPGDTRLAVRRFVSACVEVLNGYRPAAHLRRLSLPMEAPSVVAQGVAGARRVADLRRAARSGDRRAGRAGPVGVLRVLLCEPRAGVVEAAVLLITGERTWAMAFRLELHQQKWAATALRLI